MSRPTSLSSKMIVSSGETKNLSIHLYTCMDLVRPFHLERLVTKSTRSPTPKEFTTFSRKVYLALEPKAIFIPRVFNSPNNDLISSFRRMESSKYSHANASFNSQISSISSIEILPYSARRCNLCLVGIVPKLSSSSRL